MVRKQGPLGVIGFRMQRAFRVYRVLQGVLEGVL